MAASTQAFGSKAALSGASALRRPFTSSSKAIPRNLVVCASQGPNNATMKTIGAVAAAQIALLPLGGAAMADVFPVDRMSIGAVGAANPAEAFANKSKAVGNKAKAAVAPDPIDTLNAKTKAAVQDAKSIAAKGGLAPDPVKDLQKKAKAASKQVVNPAKEFASKSKKAANKAVKQAGPQAKQAVNKAKVSNPARDFANKSKQAKNKAKGVLGAPLATVGLQQEVLFGFGEKKAAKVQQKASQAADAAADAGQEVAKKADENTPDSFSIFNTDSVEDARKQLKKNLDEAVSTQSDPAERVVSIGKPGESQEENAERIRREAENAATPGGDARAPTN